MIADRTRLAIEHAVANLGKHYRDGFPVERLRVDVAKNGLRQYAPSTKKIGIFLAANADRLGVERVADGVWRLVGEAENRPRGTRPIR